MSFPVCAKEIATRSLIIEFPISHFCNHAIFEFLQHALTREH